MSSSTKTRRRQLMVALAVTLGGISVLYAAARADGPPTERGPQATQDAGPQDSTAATPRAPQWAGRSTPFKVLRIIPASAYRGRYEGRRWTPFPNRTDPPWSRVMPEITDTAIIRAEEIFRTASAEAARMRTATRKQSVTTVATPLPPPPPPPPPILQPPEPGLDD